MVEPSSTARGAGASLRPVARGAEASRRPAPSGRLSDFYFTIDLRSAGLFRILLGLVLVAHWIGRWQWLDILYVGSGVLSADAQQEIRALAAAQSGVWPQLGWWSPLELLDAWPWAVRGFFVATLVCYTLFLLGCRTRLFGLLSLLAWAAIVHRNPYTLIGADFVIGSLLLWAQLLPLGRRFSVDALRDAVGRGVTLPLERASDDPRGNDQSSQPAERQSAFSIGALGIVLQLGMIYFFTGLWKTVPMLWDESAAWRDGTAIHYVLHMEQSLFPAALWARELPLWCIRLLSYGTLAIELAALPMFLLPWFQPLPRRVAIVALILLHVGIAVTVDAGLFSYVMLASYAVLLTAADWEAVKRLIARCSRPATVYYDDGCGICTRTCEILAACDRFGRLAFIGSSDREHYRHALPEGLTERTVVVFDDHTGRMFTESQAAAAALRGLPAPFRLLTWFAWPGLRLVSDQVYRLFAINRHVVSRWLGLTACRMPGIAKNPAGHKDGLRNSRRKETPVRAADAASHAVGGTSRWAHAAAAVVLAAVVVGNLLENVVGLEKSYRDKCDYVRITSDPTEPLNSEPTSAQQLLDTLARTNERCNFVLNFSAAVQRWNMFAPDPPKIDHWWVADAVLANRSHIDPLAELIVDPEDPARRINPQTNFIKQPHHDERRYPRIWGTYLQYAPGEMRAERFLAAEVLRREFCRYLVRTYNAGLADDAQRKIVSLDLYQIRLAMPPPTRDDAQLEKLWQAAGESQGTELVERTIVPARQGFPPYRKGFLVASYDVRKEQPFESAANRDDPRRLPLYTWYPSGARSGVGWAHLDLDTREGTWTETSQHGVVEKGDYVRGQRHGAWRVYHQEGWLHSLGDIQRGQRQGIWKIFYPHGHARGQVREELNYVDNLRSGPVWRWHPNGKKMEHGAYQDDLPSGMWTSWDATGHRYQEGPLKHGLRQGDWNFWHRNGNVVRRARYEAGAQHGPFTEFYPDGVTVAQQGDMRDGQPHGHWEKYTAGGQLSEEGEYAVGLKDGDWKQYFPAQGNKPLVCQRRETYAAGKLDGFWDEFYADGQKSGRGRYFAGQRGGTWTAWHPNGKAESHGQFKNDREEAYWVFRYENGQKLREGTFVAGQQHGEWKQYYDDGSPLMTGPFRNGAPHGMWTVYHRNGKLSRRGEFAAGNQSGRWEFWSEEGAKLTEGSYTGGKKQGVWTTWKDGKESKQTYQDDVPIDAKEGGAPPLGSP